MMERPSFDPSVRGLVLLMRHQTAAETAAMLERASAQRTAPSSSVIDKTAAELMLRAAAALQTEELLRRLQGPAQ